MASSYPGAVDDFDEPSTPTTTTLGSAGDSSPARKHSESHRDLGDAIVATQTELDTTKTTVTGKVDKSTLDANSFLYATADDTPAALAMAASRIPARLASGDIVAATVAQLKTLLAIAQADITDIAVITANTQTDNYTLVLGDAGKVVELNKATAVNLTVPLNSSVAYPVGTVIEIHQYGAGQVTVVATGGVTIQSRVGLKLAGQYATASLRKRATDEWVLAGDTTL